MATLTCPFCKQPVRAGAKFCARCGRALLAPPVQASHNAAGVTCARCGTVNRAGAKFCSKCRNDLSVRAPVAQGPAVKCPRCGATNRTGARFCAKCRSDLSTRAREVEVLPRGGKPQATHFPLPPRVIAAVGATVLVVLVCLVGALVAYNAQGKPTQVASQPSPAPTITGVAMATGTPLAGANHTPVVLETPTPVVTEMFGYENPLGKYAFNYPTTWKGKVTGRDVYFQLPGNAKLEIIVQPAQPGETVDSFDEEGPLTIPRANLTRLTIGGVPAVRYDVLNEHGEIIARTYRVLYGERTYNLTLLAPLTIETSSFAQALQQFDKLALDFQFLP